MGNQLRTEFKEFADVLETRIPQSEFHKELEKVEKMVGNRYTAEGFHTLYATMISRLTEGLPSRGYRDIYAQSVSWCVPTNALIDYLVDLGNKSKILEVCAGKGFLARLIKDRLDDPKNYIATDMENTGFYTDVAVVPAFDAVKYYNADVLVFSWAPNNSDFMKDVVEAFRGHTLVVIGEFGKGKNTVIRGCTGDFRFSGFELQWKFDREIEVFKWYAIYDSAHIYVKI